VNPVEAAVDKLMSGALSVEGPEDTETHVGALAIPDGVMDMRAFSQLLARLNVLNEFVSKTTALNIISEVKGDQKNLSFPHFRAALKKIVSLGGKNMVEVMGLHKEGGPMLERSADAVEEELLKTRCVALHAS
jgi:hypothetical protein